MTEARAAADPASTLAWLARLRADGPGWELARLLAAEAFASPAAELVAANLPPIDDVIVGRDGRHVLAYGPTGLWVGDVVAGRGASYPARTESAPTLCDDGARVLGWGIVGDELAPFEIDLTTGVLRTLSLGHDERRLAEARCSVMARPAREEDVTVAWRAPDGIHSFVLRDDGALVWSGPDGDRVERHHLGSHDRPATSDDGRIAAFAGDDQVFVWDLETGRGFEIPGAPRAIAISHGGDLVAIAHERDVMLMSASDGGLRWQLAQSAGISALAFSADDQWLLGERAVPTVWSVEHGTRMQDLIGHEGPLAAIAFTADGRPLTVGLDRSLRIWPEPRPRGPSFAPARTLALSPDARWVLLEWAGRMIRVDRSAVEPDDSADIPGAVTIARALVSDDGAVLASTYDGILRWRRGADVELLGTQAALGEVGSLSRIDLAFDAAGTPLTWDGRMLVRWDAGGARRVEVEAAVTDDDAVGISRLVPSPLGNAVAVSSHGEVHLVDADGTIRLVEGAVAHRAAFSPDGRHLVTGSPDGDLLLWDVATLTSKRLLDADVGDPICAFSADGRWIAIAGAGLVHVVGVDGGAVHAFAVPGRSVRDLRFSPRGDRVLALAPSMLYLHDLGAGAGRSLPVSGGLAARLLEREVVVLRATDLAIVRDDLPSTPAAIAARIADLPYRLVDDPEHPGRLVVTNIEPLGR